MYELNDVVRELGESVIEEHEELRHLNDPSSPCRIAYLYSDGKKMHRGRMVFADATKMTDMMHDLTGYDFAITFYGNACNDLPDEILRILMYHELLHIGYNPESRKCWLNPHDVEDFARIIEQYSIDWISGLPYAPKGQEDNHEKAE